MNTEVDIEVFSVPLLGSPEQLGVPRQVGLEPFSPDLAACLSASQLYKEIAGLTKQSY